MPNRKTIFGLRGFYLFLALLVLPFLFVKSAQAAPFTKTIVRYDRMKVNTPTSVQVIIVPATVGTESKVKVNVAVAKEEHSFKKENIPELSLS